MTSVLVAPPPGALVSYVEFASLITVSATTEATATTVVTAAAFTPNGLDSFWIEFYAPGWQTSATAGAQLLVVLYDNGSAIASGSSKIAVLVNPAATTYVLQIIASRKVTPTNASHTYSIRAYTTVANSFIRGDTGVPGYVSIRSVE